MAPSRKRRTLPLPFFFQRFRLLGWPLENLEDQDRMLPSKLPLGEKVNRTRYPSRAMRYWWAASGIKECARTLPAPIVIADLGCERGMLKRMTASIAGSHWIGLDMHLEKEHLQEAGYAQMYACDLGRRLPLPDASVDIAACLHVLEHIAAPRDALREFARILRPNGILFIGAPIHPHALGLIRRWQFRREFKSGKRQPGSHIQAFWPRDLKRLARDAGFQIEFMAGLRLLRCSGSNLENSKLFTRLNQTWGGMFPSLGREIAIQLRKGKAAA